MATAKVVISNANEDTPAVGQVFEDITFFLVQRLPQRSAYVQKIESNGGRVVRLEAQAERIIADHVRKDCPPGSLSYTFIDAAIQTGTLPEPNDHLAGPPAGTIRATGSAIPGKSTRIPFTAEDDRVLWNWVHKAEQSGGYVKGNVIYQHLEAVNNRHTFQAWRDRYIKKLRDKPPPAGAEVTVSANAPPTPPVAQDQQPEIITAPAAHAESVGDEGETVGNAETEHAAHENQDERLGDSDDAAEEVFEDAQTEIADGRSHVSQSMPAEAGDVARDEPVERPTQADGKNADNTEAAASTHATPDIEVPEPPFTEEDQAELLEVAHDIMKIHPSQEIEAWKQWAEMNPTHSWRSWRRCWREQVRQIYLARQKPESENAGVDNASQQQITPADDVQAQSSQKRKAEHQATGSAGADQSKRLRLSEDAVDHAQRIATHVSIPRTPRPVTLSAVELSSIRNDLDADRQKTLRTMSSELNEQVQTQLADEAALNQVLTSDFMTSEANHEADGQLRRESIEHWSLSQEALQGSEVQAEQEADGAGARPVLEGALTPLGAVPAPLTAENLASQQPGHEVDLLRASDLPKDNDSDDEEQEENYIRFLRDVTQASHLGASLPAAGVPDTAVQPESVLHDPTLLSQRGLHEDELAPGISGEIPILSQEEVYEALDEAIHWPDPPKASNSRPEPESVPFETQIAYPELQAVNAEAEEQGDVIVEYPALPDDIHSGEMLEVLSPAAVIPVAGMHSSPIVEASSYVIVNADDSGERSAQELVDDWIQLSVPDPDGDWDVPSPTHSAAKQLDGASLSEFLNEQPGDEAASQTSPSSPSSESFQEVVDMTTLPRKAKRLLETQDILNAETQQPDLAFPLPSDSPAHSEAGEEELASPASISGVGWSEQEDDMLMQGMERGLTVPAMMEAYNLNHSESAVRKRRKLIAEWTLQKELINTQASALSDEMSADGDVLPSDPLAAPPPPPNARTAESQRKLPDTQKLKDEDFDMYYAKMMVFGHDEAAIIAALKQSSMRPDLADLILLEAKAGKGLPDDIAGIWSAEEDVMLEGGNAGALRLLEDKHTWEECEERMEFLESWRGGGQEPIG